MESPPLASSLNSSTGGKMANIQQCRGGEKEVEGRDGCRDRERKKNVCCMVNGTVTRKKWGKKN